MMILAIDTTGLTAGAAIVSEQKTIAEITTDCKKNHSETIMPMIAEIFDRTGMTPAEIDFIACSSGPGSFTGLRIGAATAKGIAFGQAKKIIPVPTLDAMAYNIINSDYVIVPLMDARREQAYTAFYTCTGTVPVCRSAYMCEDIHVILEKLKDSRVIFMGDGVPVFTDIITKSGIDHIIAPPHLSRVRAAAVGSLALTMANKAVDVRDFELLYIRKPQAEREREQREMI